MTTGVRAWGVDPGCGHNPKLVTLPFPPPTYIITKTSQKNTENYFKRQKNVQSHHPEIYPQFPEEKGRELDENPRGKFCYF